MFREIIISEIEKRKIKKTHLAKKVGIYPSSLSNYLNGKKGINSETLEKIILELGFYVAQPDIYHTNMHEQLNNNYKFLVNEANREIIKE